MKKKPNIICIISDDTDFSYLGCYGGKVLTPNIDQIAEKGVKFSRHYAASAVCTPSRYNYLTGRFAGHCDSDQFLNEFPKGEKYNIKWNVHVKDRNQCVGGILQDAGYTTGYVGKMHAGIPENDLKIHWRYDNAAKPMLTNVDIDDPELVKQLENNQKRMIEEMNRLGFDYADRLNWENVDLLPNPQLRFHNLEWVTEGAVNFLEEVSRTSKCEQENNRQSPFFLYMCTTTIHGPDHRDSLNADPKITSSGLLDKAPEVPMPPRESVEKRIKEAGIDFTHNAAGALWLDDAVGAVLGKAKELGLMDNTIIIYQTDHNALAKGSLYDRGVRIPMIMQWDGVFKSGITSDELAQNVDFIPTLMDVAGIEKNQNMLLDGESLVPLLKEENKIVHDDLFIEFGVCRGVVTKKWKFFVINHTEKMIGKMKNGDVNVALGTMGDTGHFIGSAYQPHWFDHFQLYDLETDPNEQINLAGKKEHKEIEEKMKTKLQNYLNSIEHEFSLDKNPFYETELYKKLVSEAMKKPLPQWLYNEQKPR